MNSEKIFFQLCLMLAFQTVVAHSKGTEDLAGKAIELAKRMNEFCELNLPKAFPASRIRFSENVGEEETDITIERHIEELRIQKTTHLPEDRETLLLFYDRLQQRKSRRLQWNFYKTAEAKKIADLILNLLYEEIEEMETEEAI